MFRVFMVMVTLTFMLSCGSSEDLVSKALGNGIKDTNSAKGSSDKLLYTSGTPVDDIVYVNASATGNNNGVNWDNAFTDLQVGIDEAAKKVTANKFARVYVAVGTYKPSSCPNSTNSKCNSNREKHFSLRNSVEVYGGYEPNKGTGLTRTTLSGDISIEGDNKDNVYHVLYHPSSAGLTSSAKINNVDITGGNANGSGINSNGGGIYNHNSSPILSNSIFKNNAARLGGGVYNLGSSPILDGCIFINNKAIVKGGAIYDKDSNPKLIDVKDKEGNVFIGTDNAEASRDNGYFIEPSGNFGDPSFTNIDIVYVDASATGNNSGRSWVNAFTGLQSGIDAAAKRAIAVDRVIRVNVAIGTYTPKGSPSGGSGDRGKHFSLRNNVWVYGGYSIGGSDIPTAGRELTILSGDLNGDDDPSNIKVNKDDNVSHVFYHPSAAKLESSAKLENVTITGGNANGGHSFIHGSGGGMYNRESSPTLTDVTFESNTAYDGGGMYNRSGRPTLTDVTFERNTASRGGGMYNSSGSPTLTDVTFERNTASRGGGMYNSYTSSPSLNNVTFERNTATDGGGMYSYTSSPSLNNVTFERNTATDGGGMYSYTSSPSLNNVTFESNTANYGGGMYNSSGSPILTDVTFERNTASRGGGMYNSSGSSPSLNNVTFERNTANDDGGGMYNSSGSSPSLNNVTFRSNTAKIDGGGMYNDNDSSPILINVTFNRNAAINGGGMYNDYSIPSLNNVTFNSNTANDDGGGMFNSNSSPILINTRFYRNTAEDGGGAMYSNGSSNPDFKGDALIPTGNAEASRNNGYYKV